MSTDPKTARSDIPSDDLHALPVGTRFGELEILRVLGIGGFGIVYLAQDHALERQVAVKEYMPMSLAARGAGEAVTIRSTRYEQTYAIGLRSFLNEARLLARFNHPSLVKVYRFWDANATAYMAMPYLIGQTLLDARLRGGVAPPEEWIRGILGHVFGALELLHQEGVYHRDVAPDNILLQENGPPILLDFGAARHVIADRTQSLTAILKPSYAPIEQYADVAESAEMRQGPWTDIYALGAVMHFLVFGAPPPPATARLVGTRTGLRNKAALAGYSAQFDAAMAWALGVAPADRPQSIAALRDCLAGVIEPPVPPADARIPTTAAPAATSAGDAAMDLDHGPGRAADRAPLPMPTISPPPRAIVAPPPPLAPTRASAGAAPPTPRAASRRGRWMVIGLLAAGIVGAALLWQFTRLLPTQRASATPSAASAAASAVDMQASAASNDAALAPVIAPVILPAPTAAGATPSASSPDTATAALPAELSASTAMTAASAALAASAPVRKPSASASAASSARSRAALKTMPAAPPAVDIAPPPASAAPAPVVAPPPPVPAAPRSAKDACKAYTMFAYGRCLDRECERPEFRDGIECRPVIERQRREIP